MLNHYCYRVLLGLANSYNTSGMPQFLRYQIECMAESFIEENDANFTVDITTAGRMRIIDRTTDQLPPDDNFTPLDDVTLNAHITSIDILDIVD